MYDQHGFFFQAEDGIRDCLLSRGLGDVYKRQPGNKLEPGKRPMSTMTPVMVFDSNGKLELITGSPGGSQIPGVVYQVLVNYIDFNLDIGEASMLPRIHQDSQSTKLNYEKHMSSDTQRILESYGHDLELSDTMGSTQSIAIIDGVRFCLLYTSPSPRDKRQSRMPSSA